MSMNASELITRENIYEDFQSALEEGRYRVAKLIAIKAKFMGYEDLAKEMLLSISAELIYA